MKKIILTAIAVKAAFLLTMAASASVPLITGDNCKIRPSGTQECTTSYSDGSTSKRWLKLERGKMKQYNYDPDKRRKPKGLMV